MKLSFVQYTNYSIWFMEWAHSLVQPIESYSVFGGCNHRQKFLFAIIWKSPAFLLLIVVGVISQHFLWQNFSCWWLDLLLLFNFKSWNYLLYCTRSMEMTALLSPVHGVIWCFCWLQPSGGKKPWVSVSDHFWCKSTAFLGRKNFAC